MLQHGYNRATMFRAYAKINLGLRILEKRPDGYHNIETVFHKIDLFDEILFQESDRIEVVSSSDEAPSDESNICFKAARLLQQHFTIQDGVRISIIKNIPVGAGLGGGSSDAATVLRHLPRFWNRRVDEQTLEALALHLGSDVPFFLGKSSALGTQRGEKLEWFELDVPYFILLCKPNIGVSTAWAYQHVKPDSANRHGNLRQVLLEEMQNPVRLAGELGNDFEPLVFEEYPEVSSVKETMLRGGALVASMSGSGSSVYGFFERDDTAAAVSQLFRAKGYRTFLTRPHFSPNP
jgi:4-diphosphocytidyl-2-C-methyl-D-erythritol kinase